MGDNIVKYLRSKPKHKVLLFGGALVVCVGSIAVYVDSASIEEVFDVLMLNSFRRVGINIPFGYLLMAAGTLGYIWHGIKSLINRNNDDE